MTREDSLTASDVRLLPLLVLDRARMSPEEFAAAHPDPVLLWEAPAAGPEGLVDAPTSVMPAKSLLDSDERERSNTADAFEIEEARRRKKERLTVVALKLADGETFHLGRAAHNDLVLVHPSVSRRHAVLRREGQSVVLEDVGSRNGSLVGGVELAPNAPAPLGQSVEIVLGQMTVRYCEPNQLYVLLQLLG